MNKIAIIIPSRLQAERLPNKPLELIDNKEMILHVYESACKANIGEVIVATPDRAIFDLVVKNGGRASITKKNHSTGTDRVFEVFNNDLNQLPEIIINLQGDMPNINPRNINELVNHMKKKTCDIGTLASDLDFKKDKNDLNVVKVLAKKNIKKEGFSKAVDFFRAFKKESLNNKIYHHIGIYAFTNKALIRYVSLKRSTLEIKRNLEQLRAIENDMTINIGYTNFHPLSVDTKNDLKKIRIIMEKK